MEAKKNKQRTKQHSLISFLSRLRQTGNEKEKNNKKKMKKKLLKKIKNKTFLFKTFFSAAVVVLLVVPSLKRNQFEEGMREFVDEMERGECV